MEEGWICGFATTLGTVAILVSFISNESKEGNGSETSAGFDIEGWIYAIAIML
jgi:hypothetical protein